MTYEQLKKDGLIIFETISGSKSYGTDTINSDTDIRYIFQLPTDKLIDLTSYVPQVSDDKNDIVGYEIKRFIELIVKQAPNCLELLYCPDDCVLHTSKQFNILLEHRDKFLTKKCKLSFGGYAIAQIQNSSSLQKKSNWENDRIKRKTPLDFCYVAVNNKTMPVSKFLGNKWIKQQHVALTKLNHFTDTYTMFSDPKILKPRGIVSSDGNEIRVTSIPLGIEPIAIMYFNKDDYSRHCKDYMEYEKWKLSRNEHRYVDNDEHGHKIDGKHLLHTRRLLDMATEIGLNKTLTVKRPNAEYLMQIRRGEVPLLDIISQAEEDIKKLDLIFDNSDLPDDVDRDFVNDLLLEIRHCG